MPFAALKLNPGINVEKSRLLNEAGWSLCSGIRSWQGMPQKCGGWTALNTTALTGYTRGMHIWADLSANPYIACGSADLLQLYLGGSLYDITPLRVTHDVAVDVSTTSGSTTATVHDVGHGALDGDRVVIDVPISVGGFVLQGTYVLTYVDADNYTVESGTAASSTVASGGAVPVFDTTLGSPDVTVTLNDHGLTAGELWPVQVTTAVGGLTFTAGVSYTVASVPTANTFVLQPGGAATSTATASENGGNAHLLYLIHTGPTSGYYPTASGYGAGSYGSGPYGLSTGVISLTPPRQWYLDNFGQDLVGNYNGSPLYVWNPDDGVTTRALELNTTNFPAAVSPPTEITFSFVSNPQQMIIAGGCDDAVTATFDPLLVRWCDAGNFEDWLASTTNQAGSYRIPSGSKLVGGVSAPNFTTIWTDVDMWLMSYLGGTGSAELVWGFTKISDGVGLVAGHAAGVLQSVVYWIGHDAVYSFDGQTVREEQCPVWDKLWFNLNRDQIDKLNAQVHSSFNEVSWGFPSASGSGEIDQRITMKVEDDGSKTWTYDDNSRWARTSWFDDNVYGQAIGTDLNGFLDQHESGYDANDVALPASIQSGWFAAADGEIVSVLERIFADLIVMGGTETVQITIYTQDYPNGPIRTYGPYDWTPSGPSFSISRARGRWFSVEISSSALGVFWRLGKITYNAYAAGKRP